MKKILMFLLVVVCTREAGFAQYKPVDQGSTVKFIIQNFGFDVTGSFTGLHGTVNFDAQNVSNSYFDVYIDANTINTDNSFRDGHLRDESYFNVKKYPKIQFVSTKIATTDRKGILLVSGKLTIKNFTKDISFPFQAVQGGDGYSFKGSFKINRRDFDVGGTSTISNELEVQLNIVTKKG